MVSKEQIRKIFKLIHRRADYDFFFDNLTTIDWLDPLFEEGLFKNPDTPVAHSDNTVSFPFWPPARYLSRIAFEDPQKVMNVIKSVPKTENPRIHEDFVEAALKMPAAVSVQLADEVITWLAGPYQLLLPHKVASYISHLLLANHHDAAFRVASVLLDIRLKEDGSENKGTIVFRKTQPIVRSNWEYGECLKVISPSFIEKDLKGLILLLVGKLEKAIQLEDRFPEDEFIDHSHIWRGSIESSSQNHDYNIKDTLVNWIRDLSEDLQEKAPEDVHELCQQMRKSKLPIISRFALHLARQSSDPRLYKDLLFDSQLFDASDVWHEYSLLMKDKFPVLSSEEQNHFLTKIKTHMFYEKCPNDDLTLLAEQNDNERYRYYWMIKENLFGDFSKQYEELHTRIGDLDHSSFRNYTMSWSGPNSPITLEDLENLSLDSLVKYLEDWEEPTKREFGPQPSIEGLSRELERLVERKPSFFVDAIARFKMSKSSYVRALIQGVAKSLNEAVINWEQMLDYVYWSCSQKTINEIDLNDSEVSLMSDAKMTACRFLEKGFCSEIQEIPFELREKIWRIISIGLQDRDPDVEREEKFSTDKNYYQTAINSTRGVALEAAFYYAFWVKKNIEKDGKTFSSLECQEIFMELENHLDLAKDNSKAIRSMFGRWTSWIIQLDKVWFKNNIEKIFPHERGGEEYWSAAWKGYILYGTPYLNTFPVIEAQYKLAIEKLTPTDSAPRDESEIRLLEHLMIFYLNGLIPLDSEIMSILYKNANLTLRKRAIEFLGRTLTSEKKDLSMVIINNSKDLWLKRIEACRLMKNTEDRMELSEFGWWMGTKYYDEEWLLDQAIETLKLCQSITPDYLVMGRLIGLVEKNSAKVAQLFKLMVDYEVSDSGSYLFLNKGDTLLQKLLKTDSRKTAEEIIHKLGAYGYRDFGKLLSQDIREK